MLARIFLFVGCLVCCLCGRAASEFVVLLEEDFNDEDALSQWVATSTEEGRIQLLPGFTNVLDLKLRMDDSVDNSVFSENILSREFTIPDLQSLVVEFDFESSNDEIHDGSLPNQDPFDGIILKSSVGGTVLLSASSFDPGRNVVNVTDVFSTSDLSQGAILKIELHQYDNFGHPYDGITWDNIRIHGLTRQSILVEAPAEISEDDETFEVPVVYFPASEYGTILTLESAELPRIQYGTAVFPADQEVAFLSFPGFDDNILDGTQVYELRLTDGISVSNPFELTVHDNEQAGLSLVIPAEIDEYGGNQSGFLSVSNLSLATTQVSVQLVSSDPDLLSVSPTVSFNPPSGAPSRQFDLTPSINPRVTGDQVVTITASFGEESVSQSITIREGNSLDPELSGPTSMSEGDTGVAATVVLNGIFDSDTTVTLSSSSARLIPVPTQVVVPAGQSSAGFTLDAPDDSIDEGNITVTLTATVEGVPPATKEVLLSDNDISGFELNLPDFVERGRPYSISIIAVNRDATFVDSYDGSVEFILFNSRTATEVETVASDIMIENGRGNANFAIPLGGSVDSLLVRDADGVESLFGPFRSFHKIAFAANDIVADPNSGKIHAVSGVNAINGHLHSLTTIDPVDGALGPPVFLGNQPTVMAITDDSQYIYAGLRDSYSISKVNLASQSVESTFVLNAQSAWAGDSFWPKQILTLPGRPHDVVVSQDHVGSSYSAVFAYFNGALQTSGHSHDEWSMVRGRSADEFFGYNYTDTGYAFHHCRMTSQGFETIKSISSHSGGPFSGFNTRLAGGDNLLFANYGRVVDGTDFSILGDISVPWNVGGGVVLEVDLATSRVIYAQGNEVAIYDTQAYSPIDQFRIPDIGNIRKVVRYGESGLAFRTENGEIVFLDDSTLIPSGDPVDLRVEISSDVDDASLDLPHRYSFQVTNNGGNPASDVTLRLRLNDGQSFVPGTPNLVPGSSREVTYHLGTLDAGAVASFDASAAPSRLTVLVATASATTSSLDSDYSNNSAVDVLNVGFESTPNSMNIMEIATADVKVHPVDGTLLIATTTDAPSGVADSLLVVAPLNGRILHTVKFPGEVAKLAVSEDGSTLFALGKARNLAYKVSLLQHVFVQTLSFPGLSIDDFEVLRGTTDSIVLGSGWDGVRVYDNGVLRPATSGTYNGDQVELLPDPTLVFGYNTEHTGFESYKFKINEQGVQTLVESGGLFSGFSNDIESDGYYVYSPSGMAVRADIMTVDGSFDLASAFDGGFHSGSTGLEPDRALQRVFFSRGNQIVSFDSSNYLKVRDLTFPNLSGSQSMGRLVRWGEDGFAAILGNGHLAIIRSEIVPPEPSPIDFIVNPGDGAAVAQSPLQVTGHAFSGQGIQSVKLNGDSVSSVDGYANFTAEVELVPGTNVLTFEINSFGGSPLVTRTIAVNFYASVIQLLEEKAKLLTGNSELPTGWESLDDDGDGYGLREELLFGMNHAGVDEPLLIETLKGMEPGVNTFSYRRLKTFRDRYKLFVSSGLPAWSDAHPAINYVGSPVTVVGQPDYEDVRFQVSTHAEPMLFFQLEVADE